MSIRIYSVLLTFFVLLNALPLTAFEDLFKRNTAESENIFLHEIVNKSHEFLRRKNSAGFSLLHLAIIHNADWAIEALLEVGLKPFEPDMFQQTPLDLAIRYKNEKILEALLKLYEVQSFIQKKYGTLLHFIAHANLLTMLSSFSKDDIHAQIFNRDHMGNTPLDIALSQSHWEVAALFVSEVPIVAKDLEQVMLNFYHGLKNTQKENSHLLTLLKTISPYLSPDQTKNICSNILTNALKKNHKKTLHEFTENDGARRFIFDLFTIQDIVIFSLEAFTKKYFDIALTMLKNNDLLLKAFLDALPDNHMDLYVNAYNERFFHDLIPAEERLGILHRYTAENGYNNLFSILLISFDMAAEKNSDGDNVLHLLFKYKQTAKLKKFLSCMLARKNQDEEKSMDFLFNLFTTLNSKNKTPVMSLSQSYENHLFSTLNQLAINNIYFAAVLFKLLKAEMGQSYTCSTSQMVFSSYCDRNIAKLLTNSHIKKFLFPPIFSIFNQR